MGADIHAYIEYYSKTEFKQKSQCFVSTFSERITFGRNYSLFGFIAGVRSFSGPIILPKGIPKDPELSYTCKFDYCLDVENIPDNINTQNRKVSVEYAEKFVNAGRSVYMNKEQTMIKNPDWHSETWLSLKELALVRKHYLLHEIEYDSECSGKNKKNLIKFIEPISDIELIKYCFLPHEDRILYSTINTMASLEKTSENNDIETRFVCWFDS